MDSTAVHLSAQQRTIANTHEEEGYIQSLLADADWLHRLGTPRFARCLKEVLKRDKVNGIPIDDVPTEPPLAEVIATMADYEAKEAGTDPSTRVTTSPAEFYIGDDEPVVVRIDVPMDVPERFLSLRRAPAAALPVAARGTLLPLASVRPCHAAVRSHERIELCFAR